MVTTNQKSRRDIQRKRNTNSTYNGEICIKWDKNENIRKVGDTKKRMVYDNSEFTLGIYH